MSAKLASPFNEEGTDYTDPSKKFEFFSTSERDAFKPFERRESAPIGQPGASCKPNLFFGFFHDGTRNNFSDSIEKKNSSHTNVARLYSCYPGRSVPGVVKGDPAWEFEPLKFNNYFRCYTPGVGTAFDRVGDTGTGRDAKMGAAMAYLGGPRIVWSLLQAINNLSRFFLNDALLIDPREARDLCKKISLNAFGLQGMTAPPSDDPRAARNQFEPILRKLHQAIRHHMAGPDGEKPNNTTVGWVQQIYVSVFGFSRGAASARAFANWMVALCKLDAQLLGKPGMTLAGFPVNFDFMGLFDTVASVGLANTFNTANGHWDWSDAEVSLRVPRAFSRCLHLVAGHEVRRSFPLDSISVKNAMGDDHAEIVYPGAHSDVGGGYLLHEQGKGVDETGSDMLSRMPLAHMYREARLAGVPLKLELVAQQWVKDSFKIAPASIAAFNRYLGYAKTTSGDLTGIMREQRSFYIQWRQKRRQSGSTPLESIDSFGRAIAEDKNDMRGANAEFTKEVAHYERWREEYLNPSDTLHNGETRPTAPRTAADIAPQAPGFDNWWFDEWKEITRFWNKEFLPDGMETFFDDYVHDSRAWFKLTSTEAGDVEGELQAWVRAMHDYDERVGDEGRADPLTRDQRKWAKSYERTGKVPEMPTDGREPGWSGAGYLRYRKIYAGADGMLISQGDRTVVKTAAAHGYRRDDKARAG